MGELAILKILSKIWPYVAGVALLIGAYFYIDHKGYERAENKAKLEISQLEAVSAKADAQNWKQKYEKEKEYADKAHKADAAYAASVSKYDAALLRYAQAHRGPTSTPSQGGSASGSDGPGESPQLPYDIVITYDDAAICKENTLRLQEAHEWGIHLND